jgi:hypothetical protein
MGRKRRDRDCAQILRVKKISGKIPIHFLITQTRQASGQ